MFRVVPMREQKMSNVSRVSRGETSEKEIERA